MSKALIAMSGGVDSSVAALLTKNDGFDCVGATMRLFAGGGDTADAEAVCRRLGFPFHVLDFSDDFEREVVSKFVSAYESGCTPNPCIECNKRLKFSRLADSMRELSCDVMVTGHYAVSGYDKKNGRYYLKKAADPTKDQSYVLYSLTQEQLAYVRFPLGGLTKAQTRRIAEQNGFINAEKRDSQDICFIPDGDYGSFIERYTGKKYASGDFVLKDGSVVGRHGGLVRYTKGQRKGLGVPYTRRLYVVGKDFESNRVILGDEADLYSQSIGVCGVNWVSVACPRGPFRTEVKIRYSRAQAAATVTPRDGDRASVVFDEPQRAPTKGQAAVFYDGDLLLGGGTIE